MSFAVCLYNESVLIINLQRFILLNSRKLQSQSYFKAWHLYVVAYLSNKYVFYAEIMCDSTEMFTFVMAMS